MCMIWYSLRSRRLEVLGERENGHARRRPSPLACPCLPRARPFSLSPTTSKRLLRWLDMICSIVQMNRPMCDHLSWQSISSGVVSWCFTYFKYRCFHIQSKYFHHHNWVKKSMRINAFLKDNERFSKRRVKFYFDSAGGNYFLIMDPGRETGRFGTKSFRYKSFRYKLSQASSEIAQKFRSLQVQFARENCGWIFFVL